MTTIENLKVPKDVVRRTKDADGNIVEVRETKMVSRFPETVGSGVRFGYYLIDMVFYYILLFSVGVIIGLAGAGKIIQSPFWGLFNLLIFTSYFFLMELTTGATLGKLICGYTVIDVYAEKPAAARLLGRNFARLIPFEAFSCLSDRGWHDTLSKTYVVKRSEKEALQRLLGRMTNEEILD